MTKRSRSYLALASLPLVFGAAACSNADDDGDDSTFADDGSIPGETIQAPLEDLLTASGIEGTVDSCDEMDAEVGATTTCAATIDGIEGDVPASVAEKDGDTYFFDYDLSEWGYDSTVPE